jgi:predicted GNAT superfamily acetyltransferase
MFKENTTTFPLAGSYFAMGSEIFKFITPEKELYNVYFTDTNGFVEVLFDSNSYTGFDKLTADGFMTEKVNTVADLMIQYEAENNDSMNAFWWQATRQRFLFYESYFKANQSKLKTFKYYKSKWFENENYGYACLTKDPNFDFDEEVVRFLM